MRYEFLRQLADLAPKSAFANALANKLLLSQVPFEIWAEDAILKLLNENIILREAAVDAELRARPRPLQLGDVNG